MPDTYTSYDNWLINIYGITTPEAAEAELQRRGVPYMIESRNDLSYKYHFVQGAGWVCWSQSQAYVAGSRIGALLRLLHSATEPYTREREAPGTDSAGPFPSGPPRRDHRRTADAV